MDSPAFDDPPRAKFLCSFGGSIFPRPIDGRLRYVGGETRIVSVPRDITFDDLFSRARELFDGTAVIKYQSPDDDLDALVSVVNNDDVVNMMEEYDKLVSASAGSDAGITRLRIFLFSNYDSHFDVDERESERRYVDALNNVVDADRGEFANSPDAQFENLGWVGENGGFPGNLGHAYHMFDGSTGVCEQCRVGFQWNPAQAYTGHFLAGSCRNREMPFYNEGHGYDRGWGGHHHHHHHHHQGSPHYGYDAFGHGNFYDEFGNDGFHGNHHPSYYGVESPYQVPPNLPLIQNMRRRVQVPARPGMPYDSQGLMVPSGYDQIQSQWTGQNAHLSQNYYGVDSHGARLNPNIGNKNEQILVASDVSLGVRVEEVKIENLGTQVGDPNANVGSEGDNAKNATLEGAEEVKPRTEVNPEDNGQHVELEAESDGEGEYKEISKVEPTEAEAEAFAQGLQTIRNEDLEEIKELGSGTFGSVYHGKWRGSDVAIKRIKASCFTGKPSERARLIADFLKEALILSSLHHPNVVSFYGVVRDGPDGSLATVTEFMINGSLKQFLQKKDRTIDRRKRLIIAMDAAFGMEYLHGKNIVHFDLKCENLLVNMRDPQRPICKIGDLGLSKVKQRTLVSGGVRGTLPWMAPELLSGKNNRVTEKVDVYSFGIVMWELLTGEDPYGGLHCGSIIGGIMSNSLRPKIPTWCDPEWKSLMEGCWSSDPLARPSFSEISQKLRNMAATINLK